MIVFNLEQSKGLANFFFDLAKGLVLTTVGFSLTSTLQDKLFLSMSTGFMSATFVTIALYLLRKNKNV